MTETAAATVAIVLYAVGVVTLFGVRSWQQKRSTGSTGFNGFSADRAPAAHSPAWHSRPHWSGSCRRPWSSSACCRC